MSETPTPCTPAEQPAQPCSECDHIHGDGSCSEVFEEHGGLRVCECKATPDRLSEIRARADAATPGPWESHGSSIVRPAGRKRNVAECWQQVGEGGEVLYPARENAAFVAHSREDVPYLLATNAALRADLAASRAREAAVREAADEMADAIEFAIEGDPEIGEDEPEDPDCVGRMAAALSAYRFLAAPDRADDQEVSDVDGR